MAKSDPVEMTEKRQQFLDGEGEYSDDAITTDGGLEDSEPVGGPEEEGEPEPLPESTEPEAAPDPYAGLLPEVEDVDPLQSLVGQYKERPDELRDLLEAGQNMRQMQAESTRRYEEAAGLRRQFESQQEELRRKQREVDEFLTAVQDPNLDAEEAAEQLRRYRAGDRAGRGRRDEPSPEYQQLSKQFEEMKGSFETALQTMATDRVEGLLDGILERESGLSPLERKMVRSEVRNNVFDEIQRGRMTGENMKRLVPEMFERGKRGVLRETREDLTWRLSRLKDQDTNGPATAGSGRRAPASTRPAPPAKKPGHGDSDRAKRLRLAKQVMERAGFEEG